jgi:hypothetical protein
LNIHDSLACGETGKKWLGKSLSLNIDNNFRQNFKLFLALFLPFYPFINYAQQVFWTSHHGHLTIKKIIFSSFNFDFLRKFSKKKRFLVKVQLYHQMIMSCKIAF